MHQFADNSTDLLARRTAALPPSLIRSIAEEGMAIPGVVPLWFGESAWPAPREAVAAAIEALENNDHYYQPNSGRLSLRQAIADHLHGLLGLASDYRRITVTASGMQALALVAQALINADDRVVTLQPTWPNIAAVFKLCGADLRFEELCPIDSRWTLDVEALIAALDPGVRALVINSPGNPTGWTMSSEQQAAVLEHCRRHGIWIVCDDVYSRLYRHADCAPSFLTLADAEDRVISVNSFSKTWSMTGWRLGWIVAPATLEQTFATLTEYNIAGPAGFIQAAGEQMIRHGESHVQSLRDRLNASYRQVATRLRTLPTVEFIEPDGAFYCFFRVADENDSLALARRLLHEANIGMAPGRAFGNVGEGYLRLCYAQPTDIIETAMDRLQLCLGAR